MDHPTRRGLPHPNWTRLAKSDVLVRVGAAANPPTVAHPFAIVVTAVVAVCLPALLRREMEVRVFHPAASSNEVEDGV